MAPFKKNPFQWIEPDDYTRRCIAFCSCFSQTPLRGEDSEDSASTRAAPLIQSLPSDSLKMIFELAFGPKLPPISQSHRCGRTIITFNSTRSHWGVGVYSQCCGTESRSVKRNQCLAHLLHGPWEHPGEPYIYFICGQMNVRWSCCDAFTTAAGCQKKLNHPDIGNMGIGKEKRRAVRAEH